RESLAEGEDPMLECSPKRTRENRGSAADPRGNARSAHPQRPDQHNKSQECRSHNVSDSAPCIIFVEIAQRLRDEDVDGKEQDDRAHVKNAFYEPDRDLRCEGRVLFLGDQVRTNELSWPSEQGQSGESDILRSDQSCPRCVRTGGSHEDLPAHCAQEIGQINQKYRGNQIEVVDALEALCEGPPIEFAPRPELEVNQRGQYDKD